MSNINTINLSEFVKPNKPILYRPDGDPLVDGIRELNENPEIDMISYIYVDSFKFTTVKTLPITKYSANTWYYDYNIVKDCDLIYGMAGFYSMKPNTFSLSVILCDVEYPAGKVSEIVVAAIKNSPIIFRITFIKQPDPTDWFQIQFRKYQLNKRLKEELLSESVINTQSLRYLDGNCELHPHFVDTLVPLWEKTGPPNVKTAQDIVMACNNITNTINPINIKKNNWERSSFWDILKPNQG
jgi:hypothetical protein